MTVVRPVHLGLMEGHDKAVGPIPLSVVFGQNADLIATVAPLYLTGSVLDTTYGRGMWWRKFRPEGLVHHDIAQDGVDFRQLPHPDGSFDAVCFDPPYIPRTGQRDATVPRDQDFRDRYGLANSLPTRVMHQLVDDGLAECARVSSRLREFAIHIGAIEDSKPDPDKAKEPKGCKTAKVLEFSHPDKDGAAAGNDDAQADD